MPLLLRPSRNVALPLSRRYLHNARLQADVSNIFISKASDFDQLRPIAVKDNICTVDFPTTCGSKILDGFTPPYDATVVRLLKETGKYSIIGKTNMDEFGMGSYSTRGYTGPVKQFTPNKEKSLPPETMYSAGGSSGGSALAVKAKLCWAALGTDTGGSVRLPAAWCGVVGFKPSYGLVSRWGVVDYANSLDTVGVLADSVEKCWDIFDMISQHDPQDPTSLLPEIRERIAGNYALTKAPPLRIGVPIEYNIAELSPLVRGGWLHALATLQLQGIEIVPISLPTTKSALSAYYILAPAEASSNLAKYDGVRYGKRSKGPDGENGILFSKTRAEGFGDEVKRRILLGSYSLSSDAIDNYFIKAQKVRRLVQRDFERVFSVPHPLLDLVDSDAEVGEKVDLILCPTAPTHPPKLDDIKDQVPVESYTKDVFTVPASLAGLPAISIPWYSFSHHPRPGEHVGLQIIGQFGSDARVLGFAKWLQVVREAARGQHPVSQGPDDYVKKVETMRKLAKEQDRVRAEKILEKSRKANEKVLRESESVDSAKIPFRRGLPPEVVTPVDWRRIHFDWMESERAELQGTEARPQLYMTPEVVTAVEAKQVARSVRHGSEIRESKRTVPVRRVLTRSMRQKVLARIIRRVRAHHYPMLKKGDIPAPVRRVEAKSQPDQLPRKIKTDWMEPPPLRRIPVTSPQDERTEVERDTLLKGIPSVVDSFREFVEKRQHG